MSEPILKINQQLQILEKEIEVDAKIASERGVGSVMPNHGPKYVYSMGNEDILSYVSNLDN